MNRKQLSRFARESKIWEDAGRPLRPKETIAILYNEVCTPCPHFGGDQCNQCGCTISPTARFRNKLAWATTQCPLQPPKFEAEPRENWVDPGIVVKAASAVVNPIVRAVGKCCGG